jgi:cysteine desulfurase
VASFVRASPGEVFFTSSGTESVGLSFQSALAKNNRALFVSAAEHACVLDAAESWRRRGRRVEIVPVDRHGIVDTAVLDHLLQVSGPAFVSVIWVNNETGVISPVLKIAEMCRRYGALCHIDAVQAPTRVDIDLSQIPSAYFSLSAHKFHGPKGVGVLFVRSGSPMSPLLPGHQERGLRGGTENTPGIVGAAEALRQQTNWLDEARRLSALRDRFEGHILKIISGSCVNGASTERVGNTTNIFFPGRSAADMVAALGRAGLCVSAGAACSTDGRPSHVLTAMGYSEERANSSVRFSLGSETTNDDINRALAIVSTVHASIMTNWGNV